MIGEKIIEALEKVHQEEVAGAKIDRLAERDVNHASELGWADDCLRRLALVRINPEAEITGPDTDRIMAEGRKQELVFRAELQETGLEFTSAPAMLIEEVKLKGKADIIVKVDGVIAPADFKTCSDPMFRKIKKMKTAEDLMGARQIWLRHYPAQLWGYMALYSAPVGTLLFRNKQNGDKHFIDIEWDERHALRYLDTLKDVNAQVDAGKPAEVINREDICARCSFNAFCYPETPAEKAASILTDEELEALLERRSKLEAAAKEFDKIDEKVKERFDGEDGFWRVGDFTIENRPYKTSILKVPEELKDKYRVEALRNKVKIKALGGAL